METPLIVVFIEEKIQNPRLASALVRAYNNLTAQVVSAIAVLVPIVGYALIEVFINAKNINELLAVKNWELVAVIVLQQLLALAKQSLDKYKRENDRYIELMGE